MKACKATTLALALALVLVGCGHQSAVPVAASSAPAGDGEQLPFDREGQKGGISPTSAVIPPGARVPSGTPVTVHLLSSISSATAHSGDRFDAVLDEPILVNGRVLAGRGAAVTGRIMEAKPAGHAESPGYLRLTLHSIMLEGQSSAVQSSSNFVKGASSEKKNLAITGDDAGRGALIGAAVPGSNGFPIAATSAAASRTRVGPTTPAKDVTVGPERRLIFRLTEPIPLHE
jgi:hypothetical protein